jgi:hypothetical protein
MPKKTGIPREIVADQGSDLKKGIEEFCQKHEQTSYVYDVKHATAAVLKRELSENPAWVAFTRSLSQTKSRLQQTELAHLCPVSAKSEGAVYEYRAADRVGEQDAEVSR